MGKQKFGPRCVLVKFKMDDGREVAFQGDQAHEIALAIMHLVQLPDVISSSLNRIQKTLESVSPLPTAPPSMRQIESGSFAARAAEGIDAVMAAKASMSPAELQPVVWGTKTHDRPEADADSVEWICPICRALNPKWLEKCACNGSAREEKRWPNGWMCTGCECINAPWRTACVSCNKPKFEGRLARGGR